MLSSCETKPSLPSDVGYHWAAWPMKKAVIARPTAILTTCWGKRDLRSALQEKLHLDARELDDVMVLERMRRGADRMAVDRRPARAFNMRNEVDLRESRKQRYLNAGLAERGERLGELELPAGACAREQLDRAQRLAWAGERCSGRRGRRGGRRCRRGRRRGSRCLGGRRCGGCRRWRWRRGSRGRLHRLLVREAGGRGGGHGLLDRGGALHDRAGRAAAGGLRLFGGRLHLRGTQHHGLLEIGLLGRGRRRVADELELVLAELDYVVVLQEVLLDRVAVDHGAVGTAEVFEERVVEDGDGHCVLAAHRKVVDLDVVVRLAADGGAFLGQGDLLEHQAIHAEYQFRHRRSPRVILASRTPWP